MIAASIVLGALAGIVAIACALGALRAPSAEDALHFASPLAVLAAPLLGIALTLVAPAWVEVVQIWLAVGAVVLTTAPSTHAVARALSVIRKKGS